MGDKNDEFFMLLEPVLNDLENFLLSLTRNRYSARDLVNETVLEAYKNFENLKHKEAFLSFILSIARRMYWTAKKKEKRFNFTERQQFDELYARNLSPEELTDLNFLYDALEKINVVQKEAFILGTIMGLSHKEIAKIQNTTIANVKVRIFRAKRELRKIFQNEKTEQSENTPKFAKIGELI